MGFSTKALCMLLKNTSMCILRFESVPLEGLLASRKIFNILFIVVYSKYPKINHMGFNYQLETFNIENE